MHFLLRYRRRVAWVLVPVLGLGLAFAAGAYFQKKSARDARGAAASAPTMRTVVDPPPPPLAGPEADSDPDEIRDYARDVLTRAFDHVYEPFRSGLKDFRTEFDSDVWGPGVFYWKAPDRFAVQLTRPRPAQNASLIAQDIFDLFRGRRVLLDELASFAPGVSVSQRDILLTMEFTYAADHRPSSGPRTVKRRSLTLDSRPVLQRQVIEYADGGRDDVSYIYQYIGDRLLATGWNILSSGHTVPIQHRQTYTTQGDVMLLLEHAAITPDGRRITLLDLRGFTLNKGVPDTVFTAVPPPK